MHGINFCATVEREIHGQFARRSRIGGERTAENPEVDLLQHAVVSKRVLAPVDLRVESEINASLPCAPLLANFK